MAVLVHVYLCEEAIESCARDGDAGCLEGGSHLIFVQGAIVIAVDLVEQRPQLFLGLFYEVMEFSGSSASTSCHLPSCDCTRIPEYDI